MSIQICSSVDFIFFFKSKFSFPTLPSWLYLSIVPSTVWKLPFVLLVLTKVFDFGLSNELTLRFSCVNLKKVFDCGLSNALTWRFSCVNSKKVFDSRLMMRMIFLLDGFLWVVSVINIISNSWWLLLQLQSYIHGYYLFAFLLQKLCFRWIHPYYVYHCAFDRCISNLKVQVGVARGRYLGLIFPIEWTRRMRMMIILQEGE